MKKLPFVAHRTNLLLKYDDIVFVCQYHKSFSEFVRLKISELRKDVISASTLTTDSNVPIAQEGDVLIER
jgi:hypothetical protein